VQHPTIDLPTLILEVAEETGVPPGDAADIIHKLLARTRDALADGQAVQLFGFGRFEVTQRKRSKRVLGGIEYEVPAHQGVRFTAGSPLRRSVRNATAASD
jgi:nucleoid DNA-binding protein